MRTIKTLLLVVAITFSSVLSASTEPTKDEQAIIAKKIGKILKNPQFEVKKEMLVNVNLVFNKNNEMVVLSVDSKSDEVSNYIKRRLNYSKLIVDGIKRNETYVLPVRLVPYK
jgi:flagellar motor component MotA